ncbi:hypothetical protein GCM10022243_09470 [Saccharothrix violaceirubra]|uniref:Uncharacterized protein n=1 Tax=Saccharothrix violaceirubra TaxID=413306 RepID=A0A7W7WWC3_9PSEU|nr:hypothetical protein [Saccharothrix violaceirubra]MBB4966215.1 hypothetical protein [Saccharothrix violaceirubra]
MRAVVIAVLTLFVLTPVASARAEALTLVHAERVPLGAGILTASFSAWPIRAGRSLDFTFEPDGGIDGHTGALRAIAPSGEAHALGIVGLDGNVDMKLPRHPRARDVWGLDVVALPEEGLWRFEFTVDGAATATMPVPVGPAPGPPPAVSWAVGMAPWAVALVVLSRRWWRVRGRWDRGWNG